MAFAASRAFARAFSANVAPVSGSSGNSGTSASPSTRIPATSAASSIRRSSTSLPGLRVASSTSVMPGAVRDERGVRGRERGTLRGHQLGDAAQRDVEHGVEGAPGERRALPRALDLDQRARVGRDDVRVDLGAGVLLVGQVQPHPAVDDADADGRDLAGQRLGVGEPAAGAEPGDGVGERDVGPGDRGGAGAAVGLQDVAVERDGVLAQRREVDAGAQRAADQPADLVGATADAALDRLAVAAGVRGRGQHRVLGGHPAQAGSLAPPRHALRDAGRAQHLRLAELDEHRPGRVLLETAGEAHGAQLVVGPSVSSFHHPTLGCGRTDDLRRRSTRCRRARRSRSGRQSGTGHTDHT